MFKRFLALFLLLALGLCMAGGAAEEDSGIRHKVHGDVSEFETSDELSSSVSDGSGANVATDIFLHVDPYTASYVTFVVVDEDGEPIPGAKIYLSYGGETQFYGTTDSSGRFSTYLFRDTVYGYRVRKSGYRSAGGSFKASNETKRVRVVLRQYYGVDILVLENGKPVPGIEILFNGEKQLTGNDGGVSFDVLRGTYDAQITLPDGTKKIVTIVVDGDTVYVLDIGTQNWPDGIKQELLNGGAGMSDLFIVFDKKYRPEDYDLTCQVYDDQEILALLDPELLSEEEIGDLVRAYHAENPDYLHITAEPDKLQRDGAPDEIVLDKNGEAVYSQRSLILSGWQLLGVEGRGMESILFENEEMGVWFDIADLYSEDMARLFHLEDMVRAEPEKYPWYDAEDFEVSQVPWFALENVWRWMDPEEEYDKDGPVFNRAEFGNSRMELRITPILDEEVQRAALGLEENISSGDMSEIVLVSEELREKWLREYLADGCMSDTEFAELMDLCAHSTAYRVQMFMHIGERVFNVTRMVDSMEIRFDVNEDAASEAETYAWEQVMLLYEAQTGENRKSVDEIAAECWEAYYEEYFAELYEPRHEHFGVQNEGWQIGETGYESFDAVFTSEVEICDGVSEREEFLTALQARLIETLDVDVRHEGYAFRRGRGYRYYPVVTGNGLRQLPIERDWHAALDSSMSALYVIREVDCSCVEELRLAILEEKNRR